MTKEELMPEEKLTEEQIKQATRWYCHFEFDIQTIADHFKISVEALKANIRKL